MNNNAKRGRALLRDKGPARGVYEVDYIVHARSRSVGTISTASILRTFFSADIRLVDGHTLKNGIYDLEEDGKALYQLEKQGANWQVLSCAA